MIHSEDTVVTVRKVLKTFLFRNFIVHLYQTICIREYYAFKQMYLYILNTILYLGDFGINIILSDILLNYIIAKQIGSNYIYIYILFTSS